MQHAITGFCNEIASPHRFPAGSGLRFTGLNHEIETSEIGITVRQISAKVSDIWGI
jgi:hypothetical protein